MSVTHLHRAATRPRLPARDHPPGDAPAVAYVPLSRLRAHPRNVRRDLGDLRELIDSIRSQGVLQPLRAERRPGADFLRIRAGHRRAAAAQLAGEAKVPCVIVGAASEDVAIGEMLSENKHRQGLSDGELRDGARAMVEEFDHTPETVAEMVGVHPCTVRKWLRDGVRPERAAIGPASDDPAAADSSVSPGTARRRPYSGTKYPRIRPTDVHELHQRWAERISGHLTPERAEQLLPQLLADVQELIGDWRPPAARQAAS